VAFSAFVAGSLAHVAGLGVLAVIALAFVVIDELCARLDRVPDRNFRHARLSLDAEIE
jgi:hypothetical protein